MYSVHIVPCMCLRKSVCIILCVCMHVCVFLCRSVRVPTVVRVHACTVMIAYAWVYTLLRVSAYMRSFRRHIRSILILQLEYVDIFLMSSLNPDSMYDGLKIFVCLEQEGKKLSL